MEKKSYNKLLNKLKIKVFASLFILLCLSSCALKYPITFYDKDLTELQKTEKMDKYEKRKQEINEIKNSKGEDSKSVDDEGKTQKVSSNEIDDEFLEYEKTPYYHSETETNFPVVTLFKNTPEFNLKEYKAEAFEKYSELDNKGRVGQAIAMVGPETMPTGERDSIGSIKPSGWHTIKYDTIDGKYLYNRCHLLGWQLSGENANPKNLFTGTRYLNVDGMLPYENKVADYIKKTGNHVLYRVTPHYKTNTDLVPSHIQIEAMSYEDNGEGICFNVKLENIQPGIHINYANGDSYLEKVEKVATQSEYNELGGNELNV